MDHQNVSRINALPVSFRKLSELFFPKLYSADLQEIICVWLLKLEISPLISARKYKWCLLKPMFVNLHFSFALFESDTNFAGCSSDVLTVAKLAKNSRSFCFASKVWNFHEARK